MSRTPTRLGALSIFKIALLMGLSGCATLDVPDLPERPVRSSEIDNNTVNFFNADDAALELKSEWWASFDDPQLSDLINKALAENRQLDVASSNIRLAQANLNRRQLDRSFSFSSFAGIDNNLLIEPRTDFNSSARLGLSSSWEYDAFDRIAKAIEVSELDVIAAEQAREDIAVIIAGETALAYIDLRGAQARLQVSRDNSNVQANSLGILNDLLENGRATELDVNRAEAQYSTTLATLPLLQATVDAAVSRLSVLTGGAATQPSDDILALVEGTRSIPLKSGPLMTGTPETFLRRRPDIRAAETEISRRLALSEIDRARLFPRITFDANLFSRFNGNPQLGQFTNIGLGVGPSITWEGPDLRRVRADIAIADVETERAYAQYEAVVLQALADVEIALSNYANEVARRVDLENAVRAARQSAELAQLRFDEGLDDFLDVLDAQRTLLDTEDQLAQSQVQTTRLSILTYRELAGL